MESKNIIHEIKQAVQEASSKGHKTVTVQSLTNYLNELNKLNENEDYNTKQNHETNLAEFKAENDRNIANANNQTSVSLELIRSTVIAGQSALKAAMIINGGGAAALLAFTGNIWNKTTSNIIASGLTEAILIFCIGILLAAFATGTTYLSQLIFSYEKVKFATVINYLTITLVILSFSLFIYGSFIGASTLNIHFK